MVVPHDEIPLNPHSHADCVDISLDPRSEFMEENTGMAVSRAGALIVIGISG
jgi:hypothetical protein